MKDIKEFLNHEYTFGQIHFSIADILIVAVVMTITWIVLRAIRNLLSLRMPSEDKDKFKVVFAYIKYLIFVIIFFVTLSVIGVNVTGVLVASSALLIGVGLALQTLFQDIIAGVFILIDQSVHVGDIIEIDGKVGRVEEIKLRTTRAVTIDNKVLIIPHHLYLTNSLYNWTQNGTTTRENISVGVAYGSDIQLVKKLLIQAAEEHDSILKFPEPLVLFTDFGDSSLNFKLIFTLDESFMASIPSSDLRFRIDELFRENNISIPFPQRDIHIIQK